jgi:hypothetical protein
VDTTDRISVHWQDNLHQMPKPQAYLERRGLWVPELLRAFEVGYASGRLPRLMPQGGPLRAQAKELGLINDRGTEFFFNRVVLPIRDAGGAMVSVYGRSIDPKSDVPHLFPPGPRRGVFNRIGCLQGREVILTEAPLDALSVAVMGSLNATASFGVTGFTADHLALLLEGKIARVYCAYDADPAGDHGADQLAHDLAVHGIECLRVKWPVKDANDFLVAGGTRETFRALIDEARPVATPQPRPGRSARNQPPKPDATGQPKDSASRTSIENIGPTDDPEALCALQPVPASLPAPEPPPVLPSPVPIPPSTCLPAAPEGAALPAKTDASPESLAPSPATATAPAPAPEGTLIVIACGDRAYEVIPLPRSGPGALRVRLKVGHDGKTFLDTLNLYSDAARSAAVTKISMLFGPRLRRDLIEKDLHAIIAELQRRLTTTPPQPVDPVQAMSPEDREEALAFLRDPDLANRIRSDITLLGVVGEERSKLLVYLVVASRRLPTPLSLIVISRSSAGKSYLVTCVLGLTPEAEVCLYTRVTAKALYHDETERLRHKVLVLEEAQGMHEAAYALRVMQSSRMLRTLSTITDPTTGRHKAQENVVYGPVAQIVTTTSELDSETSSRAFVISVDESEEQTRAIHQRQRHGRTLEGLDQVIEHKAIIRLHHNVQHLLLPHAVVNEYAPHLSFPSGTLQLRREHEKYLNLIDAITYLFQYQRERGVKRRGGSEVPYVLTAPEDIDLANELIVPSLRQAFEELTTPERTLLVLVRRLVESRCDGSDLESVRFTRRDIREYTKWGDHQMRKHLSRLEELEYVQAVVGCFGKEYVYRLTPDHRLAMPPKATIEEEIRDLGLTSSRDLAARGLVR